MRKEPEKELHAPKIRTCWFRFYEELNDFLPNEQKKRSFPCEFHGTPSVKNTIEAIGVPHTEIDVILIDGKSAGFDRLLYGGEQISVYPVFESFDISPLIRLRSAPLRNTKFVVDVNLGKLAQKLRLLGFDTLFRNDYTDSEIVKISTGEKRIILTRDKGVLKYNDVSHGLWLRSKILQQQVEEVISRLHLQNSLKPFTRCSSCNGLLKTVDKTEVNNKVPADTFSVFNEFYKCTVCSQIYWKGSHFDKIDRWIDGLKAI